MPRHSRAATSLYLTCVFVACADSPDGGRDEAFLLTDSAGVVIAESFRPAWGDGEGWKVAREPELSIPRGTSFAPSVSDTPATAPLFGSCPGTASGSSSVTRCRIRSETKDSAKSTWHGRTKRLQRGTPEDFTWLPSHKFFFDELVLGADGNIWARSVSPTSLGSSDANRRGDPPVPERWIVLASSGEWLGTVQMPDGLALEQVANGRVYGVHRDELGVATVRVHRIERNGNASWRLLETARASCRP